ncbi:MAG: diaminopimelate decarboxylase [Eubacteriales bacterium]|nr:diaminopimelate decarboxylase [Eubacteriales bacterium]
MKNLPFSKDTLMRITDAFPTPFHLYDEEALRARVRALRQAFQWNEGYREYYAVKACPNPVILSILRDEGCGLDCSSYTELMLADAINVRDEGIMFSSNDTPAEEYRYARRLGAYINLDDVTHIDFLAANGGIPETVCCRFNPGGDWSLSNAIMDDPKDAKYGFTRAQLSDGFKRLQALGAKHFGLHAFLVSNAMDPDYYPALAKLLFDTARALHEETGADIAFVNLSGGVGIPYLPDAPEADIAAIGKGVEKAYHAAFDGTALHPSLFTELGRYVTGPIGYLVTRVMHEKRIYKHFIGVDACAADLMRPAMYGAYHHITVMGKENAPCDHVYDVTGALCENNDKFAIDRRLPQIDMGDLLVIHDTGAHGHSMGYNYNGKLRSAELLLQKDGNARMIRRAETPADYFATLDILGLDKLR